MDNALLWFVRLLAAHLLTDFVLQPDSWVKAKRKKHLRAKEFWYHIGLTTLVAIWFTCLDGWWWIAPLLFVSHALIDWWKCRQKDTTLYFLLDQFLHISILLLITLIRFPDALQRLKPLSQCISYEAFWIIGLALVFLTRPVGVVIGMLTKSFRDKLEKIETLENAGSWIGILERVIIFFLVLIGQWEAIGLLVAAKSVLRLKDGDQKMSEYVLIGTLISISVAIFTGFLVKQLI